MASVPQFCQKYVARASFAAPSVPSYASLSGHGRIAWLLPRASPVAPTYAPSCARYVIGPPANVVTLPAPINCAYSRSKWNIRSCWTRITLSALLPLQIFGQGGNAWNLLHFDNQSEAMICVDSIKQYSIPSVPSRLEWVKTRPDSIFAYVTESIGRIEISVRKQKDKIHKIQGRQEDDETCCEIPVPP